MLQKHKWKLHYLGLMTLILPITSYALPSDSEKPLQIIADSTGINYKTGVNTYEGNVKINQGTTQVLADRVITKSQNHKVSEAIAYGITHLADYSTVPKDHDPVLHAQAKIIRFYPQKSMVELENNVIVTQGDNSYVGTFIIYNIKDQVVTAPAMKNTRSTITINSKQIS